MKEEYKEAFAEVEQILNLMPTNLSSKIPLGFKQIISSEKSKTYHPKISEPIEECQLKDDTIVILAIIYRDFLCTKEEREKLIERDSNKLLEFESKLREKYNPDDIFKKRKETTEKYIENNEEKNIAIIPEEKWYRRIFNIIKGLFKKEK